MRELDYLKKILKESSCKEEEDLKEKDEEDEEEPTDDDDTQDVDSDDSEEETTEKPESEEQEVDEKEEQIAGSDFTKQAEEIINQLYKAIKDNNKEVIAQFGKVLAALNKKDVILTQSEEEETSTPEVEPKKKKQVKKENKKEIKPKNKKESGTGVDSYKNALKFYGKK